MSLLQQFLIESNAIEGITVITPPQTLQHIDEFLTLGLDTDRVVTLAQTIQPNVQLRSLVGLNVIVGNHTPPPGGPGIVSALASLICLISEDTIGPWEAHCKFETLHPFTDGNGRTGRLLWLWQMMTHYDYQLQRLFLHEFYYQTLSEARP